MPFSGFQLVALGGEPMKQSVIDSWSSSVELINTYGTTEATVYQSIHTYRPKEGKQQDDEEASILDKTVSQH
tara:strand:+ start:1393 stop:1608 length:216 start_codon:yes stop_codon:yes gene_type:complete